MKKKLTRFLAAFLMMAIALSGMVIKAEAVVDIPMMLYVNDTMYKKIYDKKISTIHEYTLPKLSAEEIKKYTNSDIPYEHIGWEITYTAPGVSNATHVNIYFTEGETSKSYTFSSITKVTLIANAILKGPEYTVNIINATPDGETISNTFELGTYSADNPYVLKALESTSDYHQIGWDIAGWRSERREPMKDLYFPDNEGRKDITSYANRNNVIDITAIWGKNYYTITYEPNSSYPTVGIVTGEMPNSKMRYDRSSQLEECQYKKITENGECKFLGWAETPNGEVKYYDEQFIWPNRDLKLYAVWDEPPRFAFNIINREFTLEEAQKGWITEEKLLYGIQVIDDGKELPKYNIKDYKGGAGVVVLADIEEFKQFTSPGAISVRYKAEDENGNISYMTTMVRITENENHFDNQYFVRPITAKYLETYLLSDYENNYRDYGGINPNSVWLNQNLDRLKKAINYKSGNPVLQTFIL